MPKYFSKNLISGDFWLNKGKWIMCIFLLSSSFPINRRIKEQKCVKSWRQRKREKTLMDQLFQQKVCRLKAGGWYVNELDRGASILCSCRLDEDLSTGAFWFATKKRWGHWGLEWAGIADLWGQYMAEQKQIA